MCDVTVYYEKKSVAIGTFWSAIEIAIGTAIGSSSDKVILDNPQMFNRNLHPKPPKASNLNGNLNFFIEISIQKPVR